MYKINNIVSSLFEDGFDATAIHKITEVLNNDVTNNILAKLENAQVHKLAVTNFNKTLLAQNTELTKLRQKVAKYERQYAIAHHDRSANPWRHNAQPDELDILGDEIELIGMGNNTHIVDRVTGKWMHDKNTNKPKLSTVCTTMSAKNPYIDKETILNMEIPKKESKKESKKKSKKKSYIEYDKNEEINNDVQSVIESDEFADILHKSTIVKAKKLRSKLNKNQRIKDKADKIALGMNTSNNYDNTIQKVKDIIKNHPSSIFVPGIGMHDIDQKVVKSTSKKKVVKSTPKKKVVKSTPKKKVVKSTPKKKIVKNK